MSLYDGGLYNPYGSRTVSLTRGRWWGGWRVGWHSLLRKKKSFNLTYNYSPSCDPSASQLWLSPTLRESACWKAWLKVRGDLNTEASFLVHYFLRKRMRESRLFKAFIPLPPALGCWILKVGVWWNPRPGVTATFTLGVVGAGAS